MNRSRPETAAIPIQPNGYVMTGVNLEYIDTEAGLLNALKGMTASFFWSNVDLVEFIHNRVQYCLKK